MNTPNYTLCDYGPTGPLAVMPAWKRGLDLCCCLLVLPVLSVLVLLMSLVTRLVSPGPVLFRQERVGYQGRRFKILKFRTMKVAADTSVHQSHFQDLLKANAPMVKLDARGDPRLIPGGWLLRASGLDELPQVLNILRGEMSLVGPRPCIPDEFALYRPAQRARVNAVPGMTGLWQVSGKNRTTFDEMIRLDIHYARNVSWNLDLKIIFLTPWALFVQLWDIVQGRHSAAPSNRTRSTLPSFQPQTNSAAVAGRPGSFGSNGLAPAIPDALAVREEEPAAPGHRAGERDPAADDRHPSAGTGPGVFSTIPSSTA